MKTIRGIVKRLLKKPLRWITVKRIHRLETIENDLPNQVARAIDNSLKRKRTAEESVWIKKIEDLRNTLDESTREISIVDYGAGTAADHRSEETMYRGITSTVVLGTISRKASKSPFWALLLFNFIRNCKPERCMELGTCLGISGAYQAAALKLNNKGELVTLEGSESFALIAEDNFKYLELDKVRVVTGRFQDTLDALLDEFNPLDYVFIDGHHDENATVSYFTKIKPYLSDKSVMIFDDISWSEGMIRAWNTIIGDESVKVSLHLGSIGLCIIDSDMRTKYSYRLYMEQQLT